MTPPQFLEEVFERVWPEGADNVDFSLTGDCTLDVSVTYIIEPFDIVKTCDYWCKLTPGELKLSSGDDVPTSDVPDIGETATLVSRVLRDAFVDEALL